MTSFKTSSPNSSTYDIGTAVESLGAWLVMVAQNKIFDPFRRKAGKTTKERPELAPLCVLERIAFRSWTLDEFERKSRRELQFVLLELNDSVRPEFEFR